jgi:MFS family permease
VEPEAADKPEPKEKISFKQALLLPNVPFIIALYFLIYLAFNFFYVAFPVHSVQTLGWDMFKVGIFFSILSGAMVIVQGPILSKISNYFKEMHLILAGSLILSICFYLLTIPNDWLMYTGALLFALGNGIMWPSFLSVLSEIAGKKYQGAVQGYGGSAGSLASILGLVGGGFLYAQLQANVFLISVGLFVLVGISMFFFRVKDK